MSESMFFPDEQTQKPQEQAPPDPTAEVHESPQIHTEPDEEGLPEQARVGAILAYIPFLCFIPLINMRDNREAYFHARQGVVLFLLELLAALFLIDALANMVFKLLLIFALACSVVAIFFVLQGKRIRLPIISDLADKVKL